MSKRKRIYTEILTAKVKKSHKKKAERIGKGDISKGTRKAIDSFKEGKK